MVPNPMPPSARPNPSARTRPKTFLKAKILPAPTATAGIPAAQRNAVTATAALVMPIAPMPEWFSSQTPREAPAAIPPNDPIPLQEMTLASEPLPRRTIPHSVEPVATQLSPNPRTKRLISSRERLAGGLFCITTATTNINPLRPQANRPRSEEHTSELQSHVNL